MINYVKQDEDNGNLIKVSFHTLAAIKKAFIKVFSLSFMGLNLISLVQG